MSEEADPILQFMIRTRDEAERLGIPVRYESHGVLALVHPQWVTPESVPAIRRPLELDQAAVSESGASSPSGGSS